MIRGERCGVGSSLIRMGLRLASAPYGWATRLRNLGFDRGWKRIEKVEVPVISVGNLTVGGTGKTPCVEHVASFLREHEVQVAILSRGYGVEHGPNDEALVLEESLPDVPHLQGADRVALARTAIEELESQVLILDDGFQHRRLARSLDIVLIDATDPWGQGYLLPRGLLRESPRGLRRADVVVLTRCDQIRSDALRRIREEVAKPAPEAIIVESRHQPTELINSEGETQPLEHLRGRRVLGFCGIGNPQAFRRSLEALGAEVVDFRAFADHHAYAREDVEALRRWAAGHSDDVAMVTTQKDLVKLRITHLGPRPLFALRIHLRGMREGDLKPLEDKLAAFIPPE